MSDPGLGRQMPWWQVAILFTYLGFLGLLASVLAVMLWPPVPTASGFADYWQPFLWFKSSGFPVMLGNTEILPLASDVRWVLLALASGGVGGALGAFNSLALFQGDRKLYRSWFLWYLIQPWVGVMLAVLFYLCVRGTLIARDEKLNPYAIAGFCGLAGLFSRMAIEKLRELFTTLIKKDSPHGDRLEDSADDLRLTIAVMPDRIPVGQDAKLTLIHVGAPEDATLEISAFGIDLKSAKVGPGRLECLIPAHLIPKLPAAAPAPAPAAPAPRVITIEACIKGTQQRASAPITVE